MSRRLAPCLLLALLASTIATPMSAAGAGSATEQTGTARRVAYRPDAWIKLCGLSTGCTIDPLPHPWRGNDVYNGTGARQKVAVRLDNGEGVRFWLTLENDGTSGDTFILKGCPGTRRFTVNTVLVGLYKRPDWRAEKITKEFKAGTARFDFGTGGQRGKVHLTVNIVSSDFSTGYTYRCPMRLYSESHPAQADTVLAVMTSY